MPFVVLCLSFASPESCGTPLGDVWRTAPGECCRYTRASHRALDTSV